MVSILSALWRMWIRGLCKFLNGRNWLCGKLGLALVGRAMQSKYFIQLPADVWACVPWVVVVWPEMAHPGVCSLYVWPNGDLLQEDLWQHVAPPRTATSSALTPCQATVYPRLHQRIPNTLSQNLAQSLMGSLLLSPGSWCTQDFVCALQESLFPQSCGNSVIKSH